MIVTSKRLKTSQEPICIIHDDINCKSEDIILLSDVKNPDERFKRIHEVRTKTRRGLQNPHILCTASRAYVTRCQLSIHLIMDITVSVIRN